MPGRTPLQILVLNVGSSTLKFQLVRTDAERIAGQRDERLARGQLERIGGEAVLTLSAREGLPVHSTAPLRSHAAAVDHVLLWVIPTDEELLIARDTYRVVHHLESRF